MINPSKGNSMDAENSYQKEYRLYMEYALERYLIENKGIEEDVAKLRVMQDFEIVMKEAQADKYL